MTLIAAIPYDNGVVLCADSQETVGDYRRTVQKITPITIGDFQITIAGSGDGALIESFILRLEREIRGHQVRDMDSFVRFVEFLLGDFYATDVNIAREFTSLTFIIAFFDSITKANTVWISERIRLKPVRKGVLIGWDGPLYEGLLKRLYREGMTATEAILSGIYVLAFGEQSSNYIGGETRVVLVGPFGIWAEDADYVKILKERLDVYEKSVNEIFFASADTGLTPEKLDIKLQEFCQKAHSLHRAHFKSAVKHAVDGNFSQSCPYNRVPLGTTISFSKDGQVSATYTQSDRIKADQDLHLTASEGANKLQALKNKRKS